MTRMAVQTPELIPWWAGNARLTNLSGRLLGAHVDSVSFQGGKPPEGELPEKLKTAKSWSEFNAGWTVGSCGAALFAFLLLTNSSLFF